MGGGGGELMKQQTTLSEYGWEMGMERITSKHEVEHLISGPPLQFSHPFCTSKTSTMYFGSMQNVGDIPNWAII